MNFIESIQRFVHDEEGASAVEYGLILSVVVLGLTVGATALKTAINGALSAVANKVTAAL